MAPSWVNLQALSSRLSRHCRVLVTSECIAPRSSPAINSKTFAFFETIGRMVASISRTSSATSKASAWSCIRPASIFEASRMSLMICEQVRARPLDLLQLGHRVLLDLPGRPGPEQLAIAEDGIQGRAQLVAHVGQERALDLVGLHGAVVRLAHRLLGLLPRRDVEGDPLEVEGVAALVAHHLGLAVDPDHPAVAGEEAVLGPEIACRRRRSGRTRCATSSGRPGGAACTRGSGPPAIPSARSPAWSRSGG